MDYNFVLTENDKGIMAGGYIINDRLLVSSMSGGRNKNNNDDNDNNDVEDVEDDENKVPKYSIPAGLFYIDIPHKESSVKMLYDNANELSDDIYDSLYDNISISNKKSEITNNDNPDKNNKNNKNKNNKNKNTKKRRNISNKKSKKRK